MINYKEIAFTAYPSTDIDRSRSFYEGVLGLKPNAEIKPGSNWIEYIVGTSTLGLGKSAQWIPSLDGPSAALEVEDFESAIQVLKEHKIAFLTGPIETPVCRMVVLRDPDGNKITLHSRKKG